MPEDQSLDEGSLIEDNFSDEPEQPYPIPAAAAATSGKSNLYSLLEGVSQAGLGETTVRLGTNILLVALILIVAWAMRQFYSYSQPEQGPNDAALAAALPTLTPALATAQLPPYPVQTVPVMGIPRTVMLHTTIPTRPRAEISKYIVQKGDTLFGIAEKFGLKPETILWGNQFVLGDNPHNLREGQELNILPVNGTYYKWQAGDGLNGVSKYFGVKPEDIINYPGNNLSPESIGDYAHPNIAAGTWLIVPGGEREFVTWSAPAIPRDNPGVASVLGPGACSAVANGAVGAGVFIWPANNHFLSGFDYAPGANHFGIDVDGNTGDAVYAVDNGVVVYAGWNNWGYGNVVVINHGNGWQTLYAHLSAYNVGCGQSVYQTNVIGAIGSTGNSTGSHLHFEMMYNGAKVNPWDYLP
jgi:murein DD-endopeptidase MepM/ murein hydrolase activator NlpD